MNIKIDSDFQFSVVSIQYTATGELSICLSSDDFFIWYSLPILRQSR